MAACHENMGLAAANNRVIEHCDSEFSALLNPDAFPDPAWLQGLINPARQTPDAAPFGSCQLMAGDPGMIDGIKDVRHIRGLV